MMIAVKSRRDGPMPAQANGLGKYCEPAIARDRAVHILRQSGAGRNALRLAAGRQFPYAVRDSSLATFQASPPPTLRETGAEPIAPFRRVPSLRGCLPRSSRRWAI